MKHAQHLPRSVPSALLALALCAPGPVAAAQVSFREVGAERGLLPFTMAEGLSGGAAAADFDRDGDVDLFAPTAEGLPNQLYVNLGDGTFVEAAASFGLDGLGNDRAGLWFDREGDGDLDLLVAGDCFADAPCAGGSSLRLFEQVGGVFVDVTAGSGLEGDLNIEEDTHVGGLAAGDLDGDGFLDLWVTYWEGLAYLFLNDGTGRFVDATAAAGLYEQKSYWQGVLHDFDRDGRLDLFQAVDFSPNQLWLNRLDTTGDFVDVAASAGVDTAFNEMGVALGDYDNDGDFDLYVTNILSALEHNVLFRNRSVFGPGLPGGAQLAFDEVAKAKGVFIGYCGWGTTFLDADHDGDLDLVATNGGQSVGCIFDRSLYFENQGGPDPVFVERGTQVGYSDFRQGHGLMAADLDRDGDLDLLQVCSDGALLLYENELPAPGGWLVVQPRAQGPNALGIGARVRVRVGDRTLSRVITAGTSLMSQEPAEAHFGFPQAGPVDVLVEWPDGHVTERPGVDSNRVLLVRREP